MAKEMKRCAICGKKKRSVRFEGSYEDFICDSCLFDEKIKKGAYGFY